MDPSKPIDAIERFSNENYRDENHNTEFRSLKETQLAFTVIVYTCCHGS